jgi:hypothetical protein
MDAVPTQFWPILAAAGVLYSGFFIVGSLFLPLQIAEYVLVAAGIGLSIALGYTAVAAGWYLYCSFLES